MSFPRYAQYKDSGVEWLGEVPAHWNTLRLKTLLYETDERAGTTDAELLGLSKSLGVVRRSELDQGAAESNDYSKYKLVHPGQLVMNKMQAWNGVFGLSANFGMVSPDYATFHFFEPELGSYLSSLFRTDVVAGVCFTRCRGMGTAFLRINTGDFLDIKVPLPPPEEVQAIAAFLDRETAKIDELVAEQRNLIELLKEKRQALISHAVTKGLNPDAPMKDSGVEWLGEVPAHWNTTRLKFSTTHIIDCPHETPSYSPDGEYLVVRTADVFAGTLNLHNAYRLDQAEYENRTRRGKLLPEDVVYGREGERWGYAAIVPDEVPLCLGQRMMQFRVRKNICPRFIMWQLNADSIYRQGQVDTVGATAPHVNISTIANYILTEPPPCEQYEIAINLDVATAQVDDLMAEAETTITLLQERRTALISAAVTGKIDVRERMSVQSAAEMEVA